MSMIVIAIAVPLDLAHNTPVILQANSTKIKGFVDRKWLKLAYTSTKGGSRRPCPQCRNPFLSTHSCVFCVGSRCRSISQTYQLIC